MLIKKLCKYVAVFVLLICLCAGSFLPVVVARDVFAPSWLKEGAYVKYVNNPPTTNLMYVFDVDDPQYKGTNYIAALPSEAITYSSVSLTWQCISVTDTTAKLQVTLDYVGEKLRDYAGSKDSVSLNGESFQRTGEAYVDIYTRAVYDANGDLLGTTHLWLPANPSNGQEMVIWDVNSETVTVPALVDGQSFVMTSQGAQDIFTVSETIKFAGSSRNILVCYDLDTGLGVGGDV